MDYNAVAEETTKYLDSMPEGSRINYPELAFQVCKTLSIKCGKAVDAIIHQVVAARTDFTIQRGRGICK